MAVLGEAVVIAIDTSLSMRDRDFKPNRMEVAKQATLRMAKSLLERDIPTLIGIIAFYMYSYPFLDLTDDMSRIEETIREIRVLGEATAPSAAIAEAVYMLRHAPRGYGRRVILVTDGTFNEGIDLSIASGIAERSGIVIDILSFGHITKYDREMMQTATRRTGGVWRHASMMSELMGYAAELGSRTPNYRVEEVERQWRI